MMIIYQSFPEPLSLDVLITETLSIFKEYGLEIATERDLRINGLDAVRFTISLPAGAVVAKQYMYVYVDGGEEWTITFSVDETGWSRYAPIFAAIADSFWAER
jgi:hypothetical protein